jgi:pimeloyl-ACP methyl ester carboxylesterase
MLTNALLVAGGYVGFRALINGCRLPDSYHYSFEEICRSSGFSSESHSITTADGYILQLFRIKSSSPGSNGDPVLLVHGLTQSSLCFIVNKSTLAPAFRLSSSGHDVWLLNCRGSRFSLSHKHFSSSSIPYWDWTAYHISKYDLPCSINYILSISNKEKLNYIGYSQGGHVLLTLLSLDSSYNKKINLAGLLAPVSGTITATARYFKKLISDRQLKYWEMTGKLSSGSHSPNGTFHSKLAFEFPQVVKYLYTDRYNPDITGDSFEFFPFYLNQLAGGTSLDNLKYYQQLKVRNQVRPTAFDYGKKIKNSCVYGMDLPPVVDYGNITAKLALFYGRFDKIVSPNDGIAFCEVVKKEVVGFKDFDRKLDHGGFVFQEI